MAAADTLFFAASRIPHGVCLTWDPRLIWTLAVSHLLVGLAYLAIPLALILFIRRQRGLRFNWMFGLFGTFIFACGATHFISLVNIWQPHYALEAMVMALTALVSTATAVALFRLVPVASAYLDDKARTEQQLSAMNAVLKDQMEKFFDLAVVQRASQAELMTVHDASPLGHYRADAQGAVTYVNRRLEEISGWPAAAIMSRDWRQIVHPEDLQQVAANWQQAIAATQPFDSRHRLCTPEGRVVWVAVKAAPVVTPDEGLIGYVGSVDDVTALHEADLALKAKQQEEEQRLRSLLLTDSLTGLSNRAGFDAALKAALDRRARTLRQSGDKAGIAVLFADLDRLKLINDSFGHATGDALIQAFAARLKAGLRVTDTCARLGGDEFTVVMENVHSHADAVTISDKLLAVIREPLLIDGVAHTMTASFGVACHFDRSEIDAETLLKRADAMLYAAKGRGRNTYEVYPSS